LNSRKASVSIIGSPLHRRAADEEPGARRS
jgi:hypothetical protein